MASRSMKSSNAAAPDRRVRLRGNRATQGVERTITRIETALNAAGITQRPIGVVDMDAFGRNIAALTERAAGTPIRVASKSLRVTNLITRAAQKFQGGILAFTLAEALHLERSGLGNIVVAYPSVDQQALVALASSATARREVCLMVDSIAHASLISETVGPHLPAGAHIRLAIELDVSFAPRNIVHLGALRSPLSNAAQVRDLAMRINRVPHVKVVGLMGYEGQIAGTGNRGRSPVKLATRAVQKISSRELNARRSAAVGALGEVCDLEFVNGGGTGSIEATCADPSVTDVAAGSGLLSPTLFDQYAHFCHEPALYLGFNVVRKASDHSATLLGGGWIASGPAAPDRSPVPVYPPGLRFSPLEGAGEVQTPVLGAAARHLKAGDTVWMRHAKAGEPAEHLPSYVLVRGTQVVDEVPTYRGEGLFFL